MTEQIGAEVEQSLTAETWKQCEGQIADGKFALHRYIGSSDHSGVFLTTYGEEPPQQATIKLVPDSVHAEMQLSRWEAARGLAHPNLIRIFQTGRCRLGDLRLLYAVMEYAEEDLSQILPVRALTPEETRDMLRPALDALTYLHGEGLVHGHIKPGNIMACGDQVKLSTDELRGADEPISGTDAYDPPERKYSPAADTWALGMTIVEVLTQRLPVWERSRIEEEPAVPQKLPEPFFGIARRCLRRNPALRLKAADVAARLEPHPAQETAALANPQISRPQSMRSQTSISETMPAKGNGFLWVAAAAAIVAVVLMGALAIKHHTHARPATRPTEVEKASSPTPVPTAAPSLPAKPSIKPEAMAPITMDTEAVHETGDQSAGQQPREELKAPIPAEVVPKPAPQEGEYAAGAPTASVAATAATASIAPTAAVATAQVAGIQQVLPDVPQKARDTIHGTVRLTVKVEVDPSGRVASADMDAPGPSRYFGNLALQAAQKWTFPRAKAAGASTKREWMLHFFFTQSDTRAVAVPSKP